MQMSQINSLISGEFDKTSRVHLIISGYELIDELPDDMCNDCSVQWIYIMRAPGLLINSIASSQLQACYSTRKEAVQI